ncbi:Cthe_2314 family HEPN domain-containing protein [Psychromonas aquatilis]|uniref:Cthe_2314 family HEPN domain-containing protein n=1 Tax=Psychromonas aquatilis TaxID=2005072 RepID=A0ABU9GTA9_9GAMM
MHQINREIILDPDNPIQQGKINPAEGSVEVTTCADIYMLDCGKALCTVENSIQSAKLSLSLLSTSALDSLAESNRDKAEFIQLWVENSIIRVQSIYDRVLILVNRIFNLGLANESITHNTIVCNEHVKNYDIDTLLKSVNKKCNEYRFIRNSVIHHGRYSEEILDNVTLFLTTSHLSVENGGEPILEQAILDRVVDDYLNTKQSELTEYLDEIESKVSTLYDALIPIYTQKKCYLHK